MNFSNIIENTIIKKTDTTKIYNNINYLMIREFGWSYKELMETPIPFVFDMYDLIKKQSEESKKHNKKRR